MLAVVSIEIHELTAQSPTDQNNGSRSRLTTNEWESTQNAALYIPPKRSEIDK